jgi:hypothetical protein
MKTGWAFLLTGIFIIAVGIAWILTGWPAGEPNPAGSPPGSTTSSATPSPVSDFPPVETSATEPSTASLAQPSPTLMAPTSPTTEIPSAQATAKLSLDEIKLHFMDLAYGAGNAYLERWNATENNGRIIISVTANNDADIPLLETAAREFNSMSQTNQLSGQIKQGENGNIAIKFLPENGMDGIALNTSEDLTNREFRLDGVTAAKITHGTIFIDANLKGDVRNHIIIRSLFYEMGFVGDTQKYPDSIFYGEDNTNVNLTYADLKAIEIMYGAGLTHGMSVSDVKNVVYIR